VVVAAGAIVMLVITVMPVTKLQEQLLLLRVKFIHYIQALLEQVVDLIKVAHQAALVAQDMHLVVMVVLQAPLRTVVAAAVVVRRPYYYLLVLLY
jgi:hypothetical protein